MRRPSPGHTDASVLVSLREGEKQTLTLEIGPPDARGMTRARGRRRAGTEHLPAPGNPGTTQRPTVGLVAVGCGIAGSRCGAIEGVMSEHIDSAFSHCPSGPAPCGPSEVSGGQTARSQALTSTVAFIAGGTLLAGGRRSTSRRPTGPDSRSRRRPGRIRRDSR